MIATDCPDDGDLLALAAGEPGTEGTSAHLATCSVCRERVGRLTAEVSSLRQFGPARVSAPGPPTHPSFIGKYFLAGVASEDDAVVTYRGVHALVNQDVFVHLCRMPLAAEAVARGLIVAGCKPLTRFHDPRVARVFDVDFLGDRPYLVTEAVPGRTLETYLAQEPPTPTRAAALVAELARGLEAAHRLGLGHGGLTIRSVLIDDAGRPRLTGFGIARLLNLQRETPYRADAEDAGADLVALGGLLQQMLSASIPDGPGRAALEPLAAIGARASSGADSDFGSFARDLERVARPGRSPVRFVLLAAAILPAAALLAAFVWWLMRGSP